MAHIETQGPVGWGVQVVVDEFRFGRLGGSENPNPEILNPKS